MGGGGGEGSRDYNPAPPDARNVDTKSGCPSERLFKLELNTSTDGAALTWDLVRSTVDNGIETVTSSLDYSNFVTITKKVFLDGSRYGTGPAAPS